MVIAAFVFLICTQEIQGEIYGSFSDMLIAPAWKNQVDEFLNVLFDRFSCSKQQSCTNFQHQDQVFFFREISF